MSRTQSGGMCIHAPSITITTCQKSHLAAGRHAETPKGKKKNKKKRKGKKPRSTWHHPWKTRGACRAARGAGFALCTASATGAGPHPCSSHHTVPNASQLFPFHRVDNFFTVGFLLPDVALLSRLCLERGAALFVCCSSMLPRR